MLGQGALDRGKARQGPVLSHAVQGQGVWAEAQHDMTHIYGVDLKHLCRTSTNCTRVY